MKRAWTMLPVLMIQAAIMSGQNYRVESHRLLEVSGDVKLGSCGGGCCEGHDSTACAGVQVRDEFGALIRTAIFDNVPCCMQQCQDRQHCGLKFTDGPANSCDRNYGRFSAPVGPLGLCVAPGEVFRVPVREAKLGNVVNNSWSSGSNCSARDPFEPYSALDLRSFTSWGGFDDICPNPNNPDIVCVPSDCDPADSGRARAVPRYAARIIEPDANETFTRWDGPEVRLRWRPVGSARLDSYRVVVYGAAGKLLERQVDCAAEECYYDYSFALEAGSYHWWVQPRSSTVTGEQSRAGFFNLLPPLSSCSGLGGSCTGYEGPGAGVTCAGGGTLLGGAFDCPDICCGGDCSNELSHDHTGSCGSSDSCGHVFGTAGDPGCVDRCSDPALHDHSGTCGELDECGHAMGDLFDCLDSCGAMGGDYCSQTGSCPSGYGSLGLSYDCTPCCKQKRATPRGKSCGQKGGDYCSQSGSCPSGLDSLGSTYDCNPCCKTAPPPPSCGAMGGDYCSQNRSCPAGFLSLGRSYDCNPCCQSN